MSSEPWISISCPSVQLLSAWPHSLTVFHVQHTQTPHLSLFFFRIQYSSQASDLFAMPFNWGAVGVGIMDPLRMHVNHIQLTYNLLFSRGLGLKTSLNMSLRPMSDFPLGCCLHRWKTFSVDLQTSVAFLQPRIILLLTNWHSFSVAQ